LRVLFASHNPFTELPSVLGQLPELEMVGFVPAGLPRCRRTACLRACAG
jgi:hypothetical protein